MTVRDQRSLWRGRILALLGIALVAFSLRSAVASLSPVVDRIQQDFELPGVMIGLIGTAPPVCFAISGLVTPFLERRLGLERLLVTALIVLTVGLGARGFAVDAVGLLAASAVLFAAIGVGNVLLPALVKKHFPDRVGTLTTVFATTMSVATFLPPLVAVPLADAVNWRFSLAVWAVLALMALVPWVVILFRRGPESAAEAVDEAEDAEAIAIPAGDVLARLWRSPLAWSLAICFMASSMLAYSVFAWLPPILIERAGVSPAMAGALLSLFGAIGLPTSLIVPTLVVRLNATGPLIIIAVLGGLGGISGLLFAPAAAPVLWVVLLGVMPLYFPMILVLIGMRTRTHTTTVALSGFVQSLGYAMAAMFPVGIGVLYEMTEDWTAPLWLLAAAIAVSLPTVLVLARRTTIEDEWERRAGAR